MALFQTAKPNLARIKNYVPGKPIEELEREYGIKNAVKMASNENALGPSPKAVTAMKKALSSTHRYPDGGCFYLREKLVKRLGVAPGQLIFGNGSDELLVLAVRAFVGQGDEVVIADPTFLIYEIATQTESGVVIKVPMKNFRYDLDAMRVKISPRTKIVFIANPDNPVGTYVGVNGLLRFLKSVPSSVIVVLDEAYFEFASVKKDYPNGIELVKKRGFRNLFVTRTFSKIYGLGGLRVGYGVGSEEVVNALNKVREPFNVNSLAQVAATAALDDKSHLKKTLAMVASGRKYLTREFATLGFESVDTMTNFVLTNTGMDAGVVYEKLLRKGIIVRSMAAWGLKSFIRVTIGKEKENRRLVTALREITKGAKQ
jgi:histidinol-phosphate aminotransferase